MTRTMLAMPMRARRPPNTASHTRDGVPLLAEPALLDALVAGTVVDAVVVVVVAFVVVVTGFVVVVTVVVGPAVVVGADVVVVGAAVVVVLCTMIRPLGPSWSTWYSDRPSAPPVWNGPKMSLRVWGSMVRPRCTPP